MNEEKQRESVKEFYKKWDGKGQEDEDDRSYWLDILQRILGVENATDHIEFQKKVVIDGNTKRIDAYIPETKVLIEQKSLGISLDKAELQSDGQKLTPYEQADRYNGKLRFDERARWIVTSNFSEIWIYDMNENTKDRYPTKLQLADLLEQYDSLEFLVNQETKKISEEIKVSKDAGEIVAKIYDAFLNQYDDPEDPETLKNLNKLCVRIVFCLYAEDAGLFGKKNLFHDYLARFSATGARKALVDLFKVLDQKEEKRDKYIAEDDPLLAQFPYVNGELFKDDNPDIPPLTEEILDLILNQASESFDWSEISPTIFGAVFESTLNPKTRRSGGMHYTSIENIHKVIDPLFLTDLRKELDEICSLKVTRTKTKRLQEFQDKLASLTFLDPACGSGNFLTETYLSLRKLENKVIQEREEIEGQMSFGDEKDLNWSPIHVSPDHFFGIEINDFAVSVAKTALWIAESQMMKETENIIHMHLEFLPLKSYSNNIIEGNALEMDWEDIVSKHKVSYIMGNPPFIGKKYQTLQQKADMKKVFGEKTKGIGNLDYVTAWYKKAAEFMNHMNISAAFVSTNSIVQGEHIPLFWKPLFDQYNITIEFAYQTFKWENEAKNGAAVKCVIIGFKLWNFYGEKYLYSSNGSKKTAKNINAYLLDMQNVFLENRSKPLFDCRPLVYGSFALDDGNYTINEDEYNDLIKKEPEIAKYFKLFIGSEEFINGKKRYCIWLKDVDAREIRKSKILSERVNNVRIWRSKSKRKETVEAASTPTLFAEIRQPDSDYMAIPITSSERRRYIPIGYLSKDIIASNHLLILPNASLYEFGVMTSNVHMAWMRVVCGRLKSDYNYSARIVYNNFPWCNPSPEQKQKIEQTAKMILDVRARYPQYTLNILYDPNYMPKDLLNAHIANNQAVMDAYGWTKSDAAYSNEEACVVELMNLYQKRAREEIRGI